jgi:hypothetical protein
MIRSLGLILVAWLLVFGGCAVPTSPTALAGAQANSAPMDDSAFLHHVQVEAVRLLEAQALRTAGDLNSDLSDPHPFAGVEPPAPRVAPLTLPELYRRSMGSVLVFCEIYQCENCSEWHAAACGTAFVIAKPDICVACRHQFEKCDKKDCHLVVADRSAHVYPIREILAASVDDDLVIFRAEGLKAEPLPLRLEIPVGSEVSVVSHPGGRFYYLTHGLISRRCVIHGGMRHQRSDGGGPKVPYYQITAAYARGSSGAPILDNAGNVVAVAQYCDSLRNDEGATQMAVWTGVCAKQVHHLMRAGESGE